jgi:hypothetical protein
MDERNYPSTQKWVAWEVREHTNPRATPIQYVFFSHELQPWGPIKTSEWMKERGHCRELNPQPFGSNYHINNLSTS